jgi:hypothetical protein
MLSQHARCGADSPQGESARPMVSLLRRFCAFAGPTASSLPRGCANSPDAEPAPPILCAHSRRRVRASCGELTHRWRNRASDGELTRPLLSRHALRQVVSHSAESAHRRRWNSLAIGRVISPAGESIRPRASKFADAEPAQARIRRRARVASRTQAGASARRRMRRRADRKVSLPSGESVRPRTRTHRVRRVRSQADKAACPRLFSRIGGCRDGGAALAPRAQLHRPRPAVLARPPSWRPALFRIVPPFSVSSCLARSSWSRHPSAFTVAMLEALPPHPPQAR